MPVAGLYAHEHKWPLATMWLLLAVVWLARSRKGDDFLAAAKWRKRRAESRIEDDPRFSLALNAAADDAVPHEVRFEPPTRWTYVIRCLASSDREAVARAHLALLYRERRGLDTWVAADGVTPVGGAQLSIERLPTGSPTDAWRVNYIKPDGSYFAR